jgi:hypothetical protein
MLTTVRFLDSLTEAVHAPMSALAWFGASYLLIMFSWLGAIQLNSSARPHGAWGELIGVLVCLVPVILFFAGNLIAMAVGVCKALQGVPLSAQALQRALTSTIQDRLAPLLDLLDTLLPQLFSVSLLNMEPPPLRSPSPCWRPLPVPRTNRPAIQIAAP